MLGFEGDKIEDSNSWMLYVDGSVINKGSGVGSIVASPREHIYEHMLKFMLKKINNEAKNEALLTGMGICNVLGVEYCKPFYDSHLMVTHVKGEYEAHNLARIAYLAKVQEKSSMFKRFEIEHVPD